MIGVKMRIDGLNDTGVYALLAGRSGGQILYGGTGSGDDLALRSTSNATKGYIIFGGNATSYYDEVNDKWVFGGPLTVPDGTVAAVGLGWETNTGLYQPAGNNIGVALAGALKINLAASNYDFLQSYTDGSNYEGLRILTAAGNMTLQAITAGTGTDNINLTLTPAGSGVVTTGSGLEGLSSILSDGATGNVTTAQMRGQTHKVTGAYTLSLPTAAAGYRATFFASTAAVFSLDLTTGTDVIILNGTALAAGNKATSDGTLGAKIHVESTEAGYYRATSILGVFVDGGA